MPKVKATLDPSFESRFPGEQPCKVTITLTDGRELIAERSYPKGDPRDKLSMDELNRKFAGLADAILSPTEQERLRDAIFSLEMLPHVGDLMKLSSKNRGTTA